MFVPSSRAVASTGGLSSRANGRQLLFAALAAAAFGYLLHHLPPLRDHPFVGVVLALAAGGLIATRLARVAVAVSELPDVVIVDPGTGTHAQPLAERHLDFCAALHLSSLPHGFFGELGPRFLRRYYGTFADSPHAFGIVAEIAGHPVGYVVGLRNPRAHARWVLRQRGLELGLRGLGALASRPRAGLRFARTRVRRYATTWRRHRGSRLTQRSDRTTVAVLSHVTVTPGARKCGAGTGLVRAFEAHARRAGRDQAILTTLAGRRGAGPFYARLGWELSGTHTTADGDVVEQWSRDLRVDDDEPG